MNVPDPPPPSLVRRHGGVGRAAAARRRLAARLGPVLEAFLAGRDPRARVPHDPVSFVHRYSDPLDREVVGLLASALAYGQVPVILASVERVLRLLGPHPAAALRELDGQELAGHLSGFVHRWTRGTDVAALLRAAARLQTRHGRLGTVFEQAWQDSGDLRAACAAFTQALSTEDFSEVHGRPGPPPGLAYLLPDARGGGACKRLHMYLRWMVRGPDGVDLGLWSVPTSALLVPLDTHTLRISRYVGLTDRKDASWRTAEEVTWNLRAIDPEDPVRFDFALCHLGIAGHCPSRRDARRCAGCDLLAACRL